MSDQPPAAPEVLDRDRFDPFNGRLLGIAYRMLGSWADAEDVVSETWLRWHDRRPTDLEEPIAWLTTVTTRLALDRWRTLARRREDYIGPWLPEPVDPGHLPQETAEQRQSLAFGLLHLMERLGPEERAVYVLRYAFDHSFNEIATMLGRTAASCRQMGHRARSKIDFHPEDVGAGPEAPALEALLQAIIDGRSAEAIALLTDDAVLITDGGGKVSSALRPIVGPDKVVRFLLGITRQVAGAHMEIVAVNAGIGLVYIIDGVTRVALVEVREGRIARLHLVANPDKLTGLPASPSPQAPTKPPAPTKPTDV